MACRSAPADIPVRAALGTVRAVPRPEGMPPDDLCIRSVMAIRHAPGCLAARGFASLPPSCFGDDRSSGRSGEFEFADIADNVVADIGGLRGRSPSPSDAYSNSLGSE